MRSFKFKFKWKVQILFMFLLFILFFHVLINYSFLCFILLSFFYFCIYFIFLFFNYFSPVPINLFWNPRFNLNTRDSLHPKYSHSWMISAYICIRYSLHNLLMLTSAVLNHRIDWWKFFWAFRTFEMLCFLMMMQYNLILKMFITVKTEWA